MKKFWTADEDAKLRELYPDMETKEVAKQLVRGLSSIYNRVFILGLKKSADHMTKERERAVTALVAGGTANRFSKGHTTWNKGAHYIAGGRSAETQFKAGQKPANTWKPIGTERMDKDGYLVRKVSDTGIKRDDWRLVHVDLWEQHNGPLPAGCAVAFKDGDKSRIEIDNLECITRAELMRRNTVHRYPKDIAEVAQLMGVLNRQINRRVEG